ncbi:uncharacterized protein EI90DRAFT_3027471 [Cantharellus anzutake]|uniref:uncharacterized protein n=1 Tax=Cantharellus anzutake TaxID=1750568 RepID=UPI001907C383|nr:uncharacterized protein EI90DRAFT_3027471 [Cantharellus anzutake]KAF8343889.1 hypothetical protein EI90DRAFT_3027471 [Cantharellus anzutake]
MSMTSGENNSPPMVEELASLRESVGDRYLRIAIGALSQSPSDLKTVPNTPLQPVPQNEETQGFRTSQPINLDVDQFRTQGSGSHNTSNSLPTPPPDQGTRSQDAFRGPHDHEARSGTSSEFPAPYVSTRTLLHRRTTGILARPPRSTHEIVSLKRHNRSASVDSFIGSDASPKGDDYIRAKQARERQNYQSPRKRRKVEEKDRGGNLPMPLDKGKGRAAELSDTIEKRSLPSEPWVPPPNPRVPLQPEHPETSQKPEVLVRSTPPSSGLSDPSPLSQYPAFMDFVEPNQPSFGRPTSSIDSRSRHSQSRVWPSAGPPSDAEVSHHSHSVTRAVTPDRRTTRTSPHISPTQPTLTPQKRVLRQPVVYSMRMEPLSLDDGGSSHDIAPSPYPEDRARQSSALLPPATISRRGGRTDEHTTPSRDTTNMGGAHPSDVMENTPRTPPSASGKRTLVPKPAASDRERVAGVPHSLANPPDGDFPPHGVSGRRRARSPLRNLRRTPDTPASPSRAQIARPSTGRLPIEAPQLRSDGRHAPFRSRAEDFASPTNYRISPSKRVYEAISDKEVEQESNNTREERGNGNVETGDVTAEDKVIAKQLGEAIDHKETTEESFIPGHPDDFGIPRRRGTYASVSPAKSRRKRARTATSTRNTTDVKHVSDGESADDPSLNPSPSDDFRVFAPWGKEQHFYLGTVTRARGSGKCDVKFDDGEIRRDVHAEQLRSYAQKGDKIWLLRNPETEAASAVVRKVLGVNEEGNYQLHVKDDGGGDVVLGTRYVRVPKQAEWDDKRLLTIDDIPLHLFRASSPMSTRSGSIRRAMPRPPLEVTSLSRSRVSRASTTRASASRKLRASGGYVTYEAVPEQLPLLKDTKCFMKMAILTTGITPEMRAELTSRIRRAGGRLYDSWDDIIEFGKGRSDIRWKQSLINSDVRKVILISSSPTTTPKYLMALALRIPCVSEQWIYDRLKGLDVPWETYLHIAGVSKTLNMSLSQAYNPRWEETDVSLPPLQTRSSARQPFAGKTMLLVLSDTIDRANRELHRQVACAAGTILTDLVTALDQAPRPLDQYDYVLIEPSSDPIAKKAQSKGAGFIVGIPWFRESIIKGSIPYSGLPAETDSES